MIDEWGRDDTSDDDDDDYYYGTMSDGSSVEGEAYGSYEQYKQALQQSQHHLQHPPHGDNSPHSAVREEEFHYQHHKVSAYPNSKLTGSSGSLQGLQGQGGGAGSSDAAEGPAPGGPQSPPEEDEDGDFGGIFAAARNWLNSQRERLHQMELERQVEDQRRKLVEEGRKQRALDAERRRRTGNGGGPDDRRSFERSNSLAERQSQADGIAQSGSFGCIDGAGVVEHEDLCNLPEGAAAASSIPVLCGFGGMYAAMDDGADYPGVARVDSRGNILEMIPSGSMEDGEGEEVGMKVWSPRCTLSGKGMSVKVDMPDNNEAYGESAGDGDDDGDGDIDRDASSDSSSDASSCSVKVVPEPPAGDAHAPPPVLRRSHMRSLLASGGLPPSLSFCKWRRLYSLARDGDSFKQFLRLVGGHDRTVLAVRTLRGDLFGGYAATRWEPGGGHGHRAHEFYGSAQACLFRFGDARGRGAAAAVYRWSGANRYVQLCEPAGRKLAFGGGGDTFGLCIEDDFRRGTTGRCGTFENEPLCEGGYFDVVDLEVWGFALDF